MQRKKAVVLYGARSLQHRREFLKKAFFTFFDNSFDCAFIDMGCDLAVELERHRPDIIIFSGPLEIEQAPPYPLPANPFSQPEIPRIGFIQSDDHSPLWYASCNLLLSLGCQALFSSVPFIREKLPDALTYRAFYYNKGLREIFSSC